jgi:hypothetical protein
MDERRTCSRKIRGGVSESSEALLEKVQVTLAEVAAINVLADSPRSIELTGR